MSGGICKRVLLHVGMVGGWVIPLPRLDCELESLRRLSSPSSRSLGPWKVVEGGLNLGYLEFLEVLIHPTWEPAAPYHKQGRRATPLKGVSVGGLVLVRSIPEGIIRK